jgi:hypothetical protein
MCHPMRVPSDSLSGIRQKMWSLEPVATVAPSLGEGFEVDSDPLGCRVDGPSLDCD